MGNERPPGRPGSEDLGAAELRQWLSGRIPDTGDCEEESPTSPGMRKSPMAPPRRSPRAIGNLAIGDARVVGALQPRGLSTRDLFEDEDDHATELARVVEDVEDANTVQVRRATTESVTDDHTVRTDGWSSSEGSIDEVPLMLPLSGPSIPPVLFRPPQPVAPKRRPSVEPAKVSPPVAGRAPAPEPAVHALHFVLAIAVGLGVGLVGAAVVLAIAL